MSAAGRVREQSRGLLEHSAAQSSSVCEILASLHRVSIAGARAVEVTRELSLALGGRATPPALLERADAALAELCAAVAHISSTVHGLDAAARTSAARTEELWCAAEVLARRASELQGSVDPAGASVACTGVLQDAPRMKRSGARRSPRRSIPRDSRS